MDKELDEKLCADFPKIFRERNLSPQETCMCWGFEFENGWEPLIRDLCKKLQFLSDKTGVQIVAEQAKNKLGTLHFYIKADPGEDAETVLDIAEDLTFHVLTQSAHYCERCGEYGKLRDLPWIQPLCDKCYTVILKENEELRGKLATTLEQQIKESLGKLKDSQWTYNGDPIKTS